jgi:SAM-dependent methyltransferase
MTREPKQRMKKDFEKLVKEAENQPFSGWDFSYLAGRYVEAKPSWDYLAIVREKMNGVKSMLDIGTGGGERLSSLQPFPAEAYATEGYQPNLSIARKRLQPLGVKVVEAKEEGDLPFDDGFFDLIIDRHAGYDTREVSRTVRRGGQFVTQQVVWPNDKEIREHFLGKQQGHSDFERDLDKLKRAGLRMVQAREESHQSAFHDVGALVYYLKAVPWEVPGFSVRRYESKLKEIDEIIHKNGSST